MKNKNLISASPDQTLKIWSLDNGLVKTITSIYDLKSIVVLNNGYIAYAYLHYVEIYDINSEKQIIEYYYHFDDVNCIFVLSNGNLATGSNDKNINIWNPISASTVKILRGHTKSVLAVIELKNGNLVSGSLDSTIKIWNQLNGAVINTFTNPSYIWCLAELRNGYLAAGLNDGMIKIWKTDDGSEIMSLIGHTGTINSMGLLDNGFLISGSADETIKIWNLDEGRSLNTLNPKIGSILSLLVLDNGSFVTGSSDKSIRVWSI